MSATRRVELSVELPEDLANQAEQLVATEPEILSRIVSYGLLRRSLYRQLRTQEDLETTHELRVLAENPDR